MLASIDRFHYPGSNKLSRTSSAGIPTTRPARTSAIRRFATAQPFGGGVFHFLVQRPEKIVCQRCPFLNSQSGQCSLELFQGRAHEPPSRDQRFQPLPSSTV